MSVAIRRMRVEDLSDVKRVDLLAWDDLLSKTYPDIIKLTPRNEKYILAYLHADGEGAFVADDDRAGVIGTSFSHTWGKTGWVGPISVLPDYQGRGVGKDLLKHSLRYLEERKCVDIGLETMPENRTNMGMYLKVGLRTEGLIVVLGKKIGWEDAPEEASGEVMVERLSESHAREHLLTQIKRISDIMRPGLDYTGEAQLAEEYGLGDTVVASKGGKVGGFAIIHTLSKRENMENAVVHALAVHPNFGLDLIEPLLDACELIALDENSVELDLPVPGACRRAVDVALSRGFSIIQTYERMMWIGSSGVSERMNNLSTWSG